MWGTGGEIGMFHNKPVEAPSSRHANMSDEELKEFINKKLYELEFPPFSGSIE